MLITAAVSKACLTARARGWFTHDFYIRSQNVDTVKPLFTGPREGEGEGPVDRGTVNRGTVNRGTVNRETVNR